MLSDDLTDEIAWERRATIIGRELE
jgi:hypothetical protein